MGRTGSTLGSSPAQEFVAEGGSKPLTVYTPTGSGQPLLTYLMKTWNYRQFVRGYAWAELRERYLRGRLTTLWLVLNPLMLAATYTFLLLVLRRRQDPLQLLSFITAGLFFFMFFRDAIVKSSVSLTKASTLLLSSDLPKSTLPAAATVEAFLAFMIALAAYIPLHLVARQPVTLYLGQVIPLILLASAFALGVAMLLAFVAARHRDIVPVLPYALRLLLYLSPVLFSVEQIEESIPARFHAVIWANPLVPFLQGWHTALEGGAIPQSTWLAAAAWGVTALTLGLLVAHRGQHLIGIRL
jgi:teichoic acid transport system permease protein